MAEFHDSKLNMPDVRNKDNIVGNPGRRPKVILFCYYTTITLLTAFLSIAIDWKERKTCKAV